MARVTVEECLDFVENRFDLVLIASKRAHQLSSGGYRSVLDVGKDKPAVVALREIEAGLVDSSILTEEHDMEVQLSAQEKAADGEKMAEIEEELSARSIDENNDEVSEVE